MRLLSLAAGLLALAPAALADLSVDQKVSDFMQLAGLYAKNYGPYELKRDIFGFDLYNVQPWLDQVKASKTDVDFYDICVKYVASLQDSHDEFFVPSTFDAWLHFDGDIYDGKFVIDYLDRGYLPLAKFSFRVGDELVSVDGVPVADLLTKFAPYSVNGSSNAVSRARIAAGTITERYQRWNPRAAEIGVNATIVVKHVPSGVEDTYTVPWDVIGDAVTTAGLLPTPNVKRVGPPVSNRKKLVRRKGVETAEDGSDPYSYLFTGDGGETIPDAPVPEYMNTLVQMQTMAAAEGPNGFTEGSGLSPFGSNLPVFSGAFLGGLKVRLGFLTTDAFLSGTFKNGSKTVGYIRIPTMSPTSTATAQAQFAAEVQFFQQNTDALVVDVMANGGGSLCYAQNLASMLIPGTFRGTMYNIRASLFWQTIFANSITSAKQTNAPGWVVADYQFMLDAVKSALKDNRARTGDLPICSYTSDAGPYFDSKGVLALYSKPIVLLTDNFTLSAAEAFSMFLQDNGRVTIVGTTTDGGGGNVNTFQAGAYSEGSTRITQSVIVRSKPFQVPGFPVMNYYDGVGIYPDVWLDYMTVSNLNTGGADYLQAVMDVLSSLP